ncbi:hypothetical protein [Halococcus thailandensis]|uniref:DUF8128 domain-containing protein n=1 Tax=Halococcus thailandensis JCM 13552 TaxID=1227457 RepID=M0NEP6_9EURY|nr:hypothetical protein [Halococcus thailandensis]EMA56457.1 hypothetical protein C451_01993 [Halococcus thailandensis JCM 13552]
MALFGSSGYPVTAVSDDLRSHVDTATETITPTTDPSALNGDEHALVHVRPYGDSDGFDAAVEFVRDLYRSPNSETGDQSIASMEWWFTDGQLSQRFCTTTPDRFDQLLDSRYQNSSVHTPDRAFLELSSDEYVASARLHLRQDCAFPLSHQNASVDALATDPYTAIASALVGPDDTRALVQCTFMPVGKQTWYQRGTLASLRGHDVDGIAENRKEGTVKGEVNPRIVESRTDRLTAKDMQRQRGRPAFQTVVRIVATGPSKANVRTRMDDLESAFEEFAYPASEQEFVAEPLSGRALIDGITAAAGRELPMQGRIRRTLFGRESVLTDDELAGLVHLPNREINAPLLDWQRMEGGAGSPGAKHQFGDTTPEPSTQQPASSSNQSASDEPAATESGQQQAEYAPQSAEGMEPAPTDDHAPDAESTAADGQTGGVEHE